MQDFIIRHWNQLNLEKTLKLQISMSVKCAVILLKVKHLIYVQYAAQKKNSSVK